MPIQVPPLRERPEDIVLLFRKFASDCAEKYRMPPIRLDDEARQLLVSYRWPGNVRELKNITERISVIEETRDITADVLRLYLPNVNVEKYPVLVKQDPDQKIFNSEREILYQVAGLTHLPERLAVPPCPSNRGHRKSFHWRERP